MKTAILKDGKVDFVETDVLLDFIDSYVKASNIKFVEFKKLLLKCRENGKITPDESDRLISEIENISAFLTIESITEKSFAIIVGVLLVGALVYRFFAI